MGRASEVPQVGGFRAALSCLTGASLAAVLSYTLLLQPLVADSLRLMDTWYQHTAHKRDFPPELCTQVCTATRVGQRATALTLPLRERGSDVVFMNLCACNMPAKVR